MKNKKPMLIILCLITLVLVVLSLMTLMAQTPDGAGVNVLFVSGNPLGLYITTILFLIASTVWYLIYRTRNTR